MKTEITIRQATPSDLPEIQAIAKHTIDKCYRSFLGDDSVDWFINSGESDKELSTNLPNCAVLLIDQFITAFTIYFDDLIHLMMVDVNLQRSGIGTKLLAYSESQLFSKGHKIIRLETFEGNE